MTDLESAQQDLLSMMVEIYEDPSLADAYNVDIDADVGDDALGALIREYVETKKAEDSDE